jgi:hypothetical protein
MLDAADAGSFFTGCQELTSGEWPVMGNAELGVPQPATCARPDFGFWALDSISVPGEYNRMCNYILSDTKVQSS